MDEWLSRATVLFWISDVKSSHSVQYLVGLVFSMQIRIQSSFLFHRLEINTI